MAILVKYSKYQKGYRLIFSHTFQNIAKYAKNQKALIVGPFWTILKLTPKSTLLSFTILYSFLICTKLTTC